MKINACILQNHQKLKLEMTNIKKPLLMLSATVVGLLMLPSTASAFTLSHLSSDSGYADSKTDNKYSADEKFNAIFDDDAFVAEGRIGGKTTYELDIHTVNTDGSFKVPQSREFTWGNGVAQAFSLIYDKISKKVTYNVGQQTITYTASNPFTDLFIRTAAVVANTSTKVDNLKLNNVAIAASSFAQKTANATENAYDYLRIRGVSNSFTLTGLSTFVWTGNAPTQSRLAYQIKAVTTTDSTSVPEPSATLGLTLGAIALALKTKRQKQTV
jgi:hypothetical protein